MPPSGFFWALFDDDDLRADIYIAVYFIYVRITEGDTSECPVDAFADQVGLTIRHTMYAYAASNGSTGGDMTVGLIVLELFQALPGRIVQQHKFIPPMIGIYGLYVKYAFGGAFISLVFFVIPGI